MKVWLFTLQIVVVWQRCCGFELFAYILAYLRCWSLHFIKDACKKHVKYDHEISKGCCKNMPCYAYFPLFHFIWFIPVEGKDTVILLHGSILFNRIQMFSCATCNTYYMASLHHIHSAFFQSSQGTAIDDSVQPGGSRSLLRFLWRIWIALGQLRLDLPEPSRCRECLRRGPQLLCFCFMNQLYSK